MFPLNQKLPLGGSVPGWDLEQMTRMGTDVQDRKALAGAGQVCPPPCLAQHLEARPPLPAVISFLPGAV